MLVHITPPRKYTGIITLRLAVACKDKRQAVMHDGVMSNKLPIQFQLMLSMIFALENSCFNLVYFFVAIGLFTECMSFCMYHI